MGRDPAAPVVIPPRQERHHVGEREDGERPQRGPEASALDAGGVVAHGAAFSAATRASTITDALMTAGSRG
jgi:hypothetical protein